MYTHMCKSMSSKCYMYVYTVNLFFLACADETQYTNMTWSSPQRLGLQLTSESVPQRAQPPGQNQYEAEAMLFELTGSGLSTFRHSLI